MFVCCVETVGCMFVCHLLLMCVCVNVCMHVC